MERYLLMHRENAQTFMPTHTHTHTLDSIGITSVRISCKVAARQATSLLNQSQKT